MATLSGNWGHINVLNQCRGLYGCLKISRNFSTPHPFCVLIRRGLWQQLGELNTEYHGFIAYWILA